MPNAFADKTVGETFESIDWNIWQPCLWRFDSHV